MTMASPRPRSPPDQRSHRWVRWPSPARDGSYEPDRLTTTWRADGREVRLGGAAGFVLDADVADLLVVAARDEDGHVAVLTVDAAGPGDPGRAGGDGRRDPTAVHGGLRRRRRHRGPPSGASRAATPRTCSDRLLALGVVAAACDAVGLPSGHWTSPPATPRTGTQFGKPIGSFQAVKHHCADMAIAVETARAAVDGRRRSAGRRSGRVGDDGGASTASYVGPACSTGLRPRPAASTAASASPGSTTATSS